MTRLEDVNGSIPPIMRMTMVFIDRVGFPILAFCLMFAFAYFSMQKMTAALEDNTKALVEMSVASQAFRAKVGVEHENLRERVDKVLDNQSLILRGVRNQ